MGKAAEETAEVKAQNEDFSKKAVRWLGGGALLQMPCFESGLPVFGRVFYVLLVRHSG